MSDLAKILGHFTTATGCGVQMWSAETESGRLRVEAASEGGSKRTVVPESYDSSRLPRPGSPPVTLSEDPSFIVSHIPGMDALWLTVEGCTGSAESQSQMAQFLAGVVGSVLQSASEAEQAATELAERYEEINLLYTISEILGRTVTMQEATSIILHEVSSTVGARKGAILVHDRVTDTLQAAAAIGVSPLDTMPIATDDESSVSARVFNSRLAMLVDDDQHMCPAEMIYREGAMLSVPIMWTTPDGGEPLGVVNLSGRKAGHLFSAGDQKLVTAIASQIASAIQNSRLVRESMNQQRLKDEMELAHDLQMRLLPDGKAVAADATIAARVVPADSVGGDFYNLFPLPLGRTGALVGDVSGHGYRAALIMALAMSASAIHAQTTADPGEMLNALRASLQEELLTTEMFISIFYGVTDPAAGTLRFANTGHPHAFVVRADGSSTRLAALDPPLGMSDDYPSVATIPWTAGEDLLVVFTDGVSDARSAAAERLGEDRVMELVVSHRFDHPEKILEVLFAAITDHIGEGASRDDLTFLVLRN